MRAVLSILAIAIILLTASGCAARTELSIEDAWARPAFKGDNSAAYMVIKNMTEQGDGLIGASSDVANVTEIHLSKMDAEGTMSMERQDLIGVPAGESVMLEPGGLHVMLMNMVHDLNVGDTFELTLEFQRGGDVRVEVEVKQP
jgi:copper(I)-binding protein